jgi:hypothetical protein
MSHYPTKLNQQDGFSLSSSWKPHTQEEEGCIKGQDSCMQLIKCPHEQGFSFLTFVLDLTGAVFLFADISSCLFKDFVAPSLDFTSHIFLSPFLFVQTVFRHTHWL